MNEEFKVIFKRSVGEISEEFTFETYSDFINFYYTDNNIDIDNYPNVNEEK